MHTKKTYQVPRKISPKYLIKVPKSTSKVPASMLWKSENITLLSGFWAKKWYFFCFPLLLYVSYSIAEKDMQILREKKNPIV